MHLFTYGSLMYRQVWEQVVTGAYPACSGVVHGYVRRRIVGETYPALVHAAPTETVAGVVYLHISAVDLAAVDAFEAEGSAYARIVVPVTVAQGDVLEAWTYLYLHAAGVEHTVWDPEHFARADLDHFLSTYCRTHTPGRAHDQ